MRSGFLGLQAADGKADVDQDVIAGLGLGDEIEVDLAGDAAELDFGHAAEAEIGGFQNFAGHS